MPIVFVHGVPDTHRVWQLVLWGKADPYAATRFGERLATRNRAPFVALDCSHWWQLERPTEVAAHLQRFWASSPCARRRS